jgi:hypothetical protein
MAITQCMPAQAKQDFLGGLHHAADTYKIALYTSAVTLNSSSATYSSTNEVANGNGYTTGGVTLSGYATGSVGDGAGISAGWISFSNPSWAAASFTAHGAAIYNSSKSNKIVAIIDFAADYTATNGTFTVNLPAAGSKAIITISGSA